MYIYVDILIITNIYANFFLLKATSRLTHSPLKNSRCIIAAMTGSLFSLVILLPELDTGKLLTVRILSAALPVYISFHGQELRELYKTGLTFFFVSLVFAGAEYAFAMLGSEKNMLWHNSVLYVNISLFTLIISTAAAYAALCILRRFLDASNGFDGSYTLTVITDNGTLSVKAVSDSCNNLTDAFSGKPVIVCGRKMLTELFGDELLDSLLKCTVSSAGENIPQSAYGWRYIPFSTINSDGLLPAFLPSCVYIKNNESGKVNRVDAYIGVTCRELDHAVFNPKSIHNGN